jgi:hypothetical protein
VPGMNSGLNPADPTLVAAFRSALFHQGAIALIIIAFLWLAWATARAWRLTTPGAKREAGKRTAGQAIRAPGPWRALPPAPARTVTLAPPAGESALASSSGGYDALAASGSVLTVWRLASAAWAKVQVIHVPIEYGSSG